jgi:hypothetical protein
MSHRQGFENQGIDQTEDCGIGPNSQRQREDRHGGKSRTPANGAQCIAKVLQDGIRHIVIVTACGRFG